ncbi:MAG: STAS domain-containing protein [Solirubrobacteraceae bacterium]
MQEPHPPHPPQEPHPPHPPHPPPARCTGVLVIGHPVADGDAPRLCARLAAIIAAGDANTIVCDVGALRPTTQAVEALARLQLTARRHGRRIRLRRASADLLQVLAFVGLGGVLPALGEARLRGVQRQRLAEEREDPRDVEEAVDRDDPSL